MNEKYKKYRYIFWDSLQISNDNVCVCVYYTNDLLPPEDTSLPLIYCIFNTFAIFLKTLLTENNKILK